MPNSPFKDEVVRLIPQLRAYATALTRSRSEADDLVQDTLVRAWSYRSAFQPDAQLKPWLFKILRTRFYTDIAKRRLTVQDVDGQFAASLSCSAECVFHAIVGTDSTGWWAVIPRDHGRGFHGIVGASRLRGLGK